MAATHRHGVIGFLTGAVMALGSAGLTTVTTAAPAAAATPSVEGLDAAGQPSAFTAIQPLRLADTRGADCGCSRVDDRTIRVSIEGRPGITGPITAAAVTVTMVNGRVPGFATVYPAGAPKPSTSIVNAGSGGIASNSAIVPVGADGAIDVATNVAADVIVDVTGVFAASTGASAGRFVSVAPRRLLDTRLGGGAAVLPSGNVTLAVPDGVNADATAVAVNVTSVDEYGPGFVAGFAAGTAAPATSFINPDGSRQARAATVILPISPQGLTLTTTAGGHLVVDLLGWFTGTSAGLGTTGLFVPVAPARLLDTRSNGPRIWPVGTRELGLPSGDAAAIVTNVTVDRTDATGFVTAYPAGTERPGTSSLNATGSNATVANLAISTTSARGVAYHSSGGADLIVDITGYFTGTPVEAPLPVPANTVPRHRVMLVGDSTLGALHVVTGTSRALTGFDYVLDAANCRRLVQAGCKSDYSQIVPSTVVEAINGARGRFDIVVVKAGYNDPLSPFVPALDAIVAAARAKGATKILWLTYSNPDSKLEYLLEQDNAILHSLAGSALYPDLVALDWRNYAPVSTGWYVADRHHLNVPGSYATADYISRWIAALEHRPCEQPWAPGQPILDPCPVPDEYAAATGTVPALRAIYGF